MAEEEKLDANEARCWRCGEVVVKQALVCPKCGQKSPAAKSVQTFQYINMAVIGILMVVGTIIVRIQIPDDVFEFFGSLGVILMITFIFLGVAGVAVGILGMVFTGKARGIKARERQDTTSAGGR